jgi:hypothetical protein
MSIFIHFSDFFIACELIQQLSLFADTIFTAQEGIKGRSFDNLTTVHPIGLFFLVAACIAILIGSTKHAFLAFIVMACFVSSAQRVVIGGIDFDFTRILIMVGILRLLVRFEWNQFRFTVLDWLVFSWGTSRLFCHTLLWMDVNKFITSCGHFLDITIGYLVLRCMVRSTDDLLTLARIFSWCSIPVAMFFLIEYLTSYNVFSVFGGVPETTVMREGKLRCQGAFAHPIVAGSFWAAIFPSLIGMMRCGRSNLILGLTGSFACLLIIYTCTSSTPVFGLLAGLVGLLFWLFRSAVIPVLFAVSVLIPILHLVMKAPVWHLISRISAVGGSTGYHRFNLLDQFVNRFDEWALFGTKSTLHWGNFLFDVANQYVFQGVMGGISTFLLFVAVLVAAFVLVGKILSRLQHQGRESFLVWCLGCSLVTHCACFIGISYFGQITQLLNLHLAFVSGLASCVYLSLDGNADVLCEIDFEAMSQVED